MVSDPGEAGLGWPIEGDRVLGLLEALYRIGIIGIEGPSGTHLYVESRSFDDVRPLVGDDSIIEIHPALWRYLGCSEGEQVGQGIETARKPPWGRLSWIRRLLVGED